MNKWLIKGSRYESTRSQTKSVFEESLHSIDRSQTRLKERL